MFLYKTMEANKKNTYNSYLNMTKYCKGGRMKLGNESTNNNKISNESQITEQNPQEKLKYIFPSLPQEEIDNILGRCENNIEKAISLVKNIKNKGLKLNKLTNPVTKENNEKRRLKRGIKKRNYFSSIENDPYLKNENTNNPTTTGNNKEQSKIHDTNVSISHNNNPSNVFIEPNNNNIAKINENQLRKNNYNVHNNNVLTEKKLENQKNNNNNESNILNNNNNNSLDMQRTELIKRQVNYLIGKFKEMNNIQELKDLLTMIGFPVVKEESIESMEEKLGKKIKINQNEKDSIVQKYKEFTETEQIIEEQKEKIEKLTDTLGNLIDIESLQKLREVRLKNEWNELINNNQENNDFYGGAKEGY